MNGSSAATIAQLTNLVSNSPHWGPWINKFCKSVSLADLGNTSAQPRPFALLDLVHSTLQFFEDGGKFFYIEQMCIPLVSEAL